MTVYKNIISTLWLDIGGVLLTNGWDHLSREKAATFFGFDYKDFDEKHKLYYNLHEIGLISLSQYLDHVLFYKSQNFSKPAFIEFMHEQSKPYEETIHYFKRLKKTHALRVAALSNEGYELAEHRIKKFKLNTFIDEFFVSCFIGLQKPDPRFYQTALDVMQLEKEKILYIDDREHLIKAAVTLGFQGIQCKQNEAFRKTVTDLFKTS